MDIRKQWDRWGWLIALGMFVLIFLRVLYGREPFCAGEEEHCFREWISAVSGWLAAAIAAPTLYFLWKQVLTAQMQAHDTLKVELRRTIAIARKGVAAGKGLQTWENSFKIPPEAFGHPSGLKTFTSIVLDLQTSLEDEIFQLIEREISFPAKYNSTFMRNYGRTFVADNQPIFNAPAIADLKTAESVRRDWEIFVRLCALYGKEVEQLCDEFILDSGHLLSKYS